jgi:hypothetical protein
VLHREWPAGPPYAAHDLVGDQQHVMVAADIGETLHVAIGRNSGAQRGAHNRLKDKCGHGVRLAAISEERLQLFRAGQAAFGIRELERAMTTETRSNVSPLRQQRLVRRTADQVPAYRHGAERAAMVALAPADHAKSLRLSVLEKKLARQLDRGLIGL